MHLRKDKPSLPEATNFYVPSTAGDNGGDSVFSEQMRLDIDHDSGPTLPNVHFSETKDSGVGRSPRDPGPGSGLRSLGESSVPPAWLQDVSFHLLLHS